MERRHFLKLVGLGCAVPLGAARGQGVPMQTAPTWQAGDIKLSQPFDKDIILVACGGAGIEMTKGIDKVTYGIRRIVALDTDRAALRRAHHCDAVYWVRRKDGREVTSGDDAWEAAEECRGQIAQLIGAPLLAIIVTGLGGVAGFGLPYMAARCAKQAGATSVAFATLPLAYEGDDVSALAAAGQLLLNEETHNLLTYDHRLADRFLPALGRSSALYEYAAQGLRQYLWNTVGCHTRNGLVGLDFEDVRTVLRHKPENEGYEGFYSWPTSKLGWGSASGPDRAYQATAIAVMHPMLEVDHLGPLHGASVSIRAARGAVKIREVNEVIRVVRDHIDPHTYLIFNAVADDTLEGLLEVSIILVPKGDEVG